MKPIEYLNNQARRYRALADDGKREVVKLKAEIEEKLTLVANDEAAATEFEKAILALGGVVEAQHAAEIETADAAGCAEAKQ